MGFFVVVCAILFIILWISVDSNDPFSGPAHYMSGPLRNGHAADKLINDLLDLAVQLECAGKHKEAIEALGRGLHTVQDRLAHQHSGWPDHIISLGMVDYPGMHQQEYSDALNSSNAYIRQFLGRTHGD
jgi:hypothetical protein